MDTKNIGDVKQRVVVSGTIRSIERWETEYGNRTDLHIINADGTHAFWKASKYLDVNVGDPIAVRATIFGYKRRNEEVVVEITNGRVLEGALAIF